ncbi:hypothetical protein BPA30113_03595 [Burkholderia paludis]|uniref:Uncharacterized protein n=1 Tax=Burkholderia paludis TaxID=1506587 RepID=A0A6J5DIV2_9BURK|nr:hypothetical protein LMG30113_02137 [Burkholderia paludis]VWB78678.1 hypothetical protein BPA30113_03595 [Burkholderia paludis]
MGARGRGGLPDGTAGSGRAARIAGEAAAMAVQARYWCLQVIFTAVVGVRWLGADGWPSVAGRRRLDVAGMRSWLSMAKLVAACARVAGVGRRHVVDEAVVPVAVERPCGQPRPLFRPAVDILSAIRAWVAVVRRADARLIAGGGAHRRRFQRSRVARPALPSGRAAGDTVRNVDERGRGHLRCGVLRQANGIVPRVERRRFLREVDTDADEDTALCVTRVVLRTQRCE